VTVFPGDIIVGDGEGVVVIPALIAEEVANECYIQEVEEEFAFLKVAEGESSIGLFPLSDARRPEFEEWLKTRG
jgi:5-oxopent-3-ene-1,2,5-tricarboxylate decarboxylase / 2-hydroxyhepta-2,4-diene-1,7-dioate isomerase